MDKLPFEIVDRIVTLCCPGWEYRPLQSQSWRMSSYAGVSRTFQAVVERRTFKELEISSSDVEQLFDFFNPDRSRALQTLTFKVVLPTYDESKYAKYEQQEDRHRNDTAFSLAIERLFALLSLDGCQDLRPPIHMVLSDVSSPNDWSSLQSDAREVRFRKAVLGHHRDLFEQRFKYSFLNLLYPPTKLPKLPRVSSFEILEKEGRQISPLVGALISSRLHNLRVVAWQFRAEVSRFPALRRRLRRELALALRDLTLPAMESFTLHYSAPAPADQEFDISDLMERGELGLSHQLGRFVDAHNLVNIHLSGPISVDEGLFSALLSATEDKCWPNLRHFKLYFSPIAPDGSWYFGQHPTGNLAYFEQYEPIEDDPGYEFGDADDAEEIRDPTEEYDARKENSIGGSGQKNIFRLWPTKRLESLLRAAGLGVSRMPRVQVFCIASPLCVAGDDLRLFGLRYIAGDTVGPYSIHPVGEWDSDDGADRHMNRLQCNVPVGWRMSPELANLWATRLKLVTPIKYFQWNLPVDPGSEDHWSWEDYNFLEGPAYHAV